MIILEKPYVSDFLIETIKNNNFPVLDNEISRKYFSKDCLISLEKLSCFKDEMFYSNSENSIDIINTNFKDSNLSSMIELSKNKVLFRDKIKKLFPNYFYDTVGLSKIKNYDIKKLKFPVILKPNVGFLSFGVYPVKSEKEWFEVLNKLDDDIEKFKDIFPKDVVDTDNFIIEEMIEGDEYALDAYFDNESQATILNIFHHPFFDENDVSDRVYYCSKEILEKYIEPFNNLLNKIGKEANYKNFPFHLELRVKKDGQIIPIEMNPMRFCGWCITDIAYWAWGVNVYEYFFKKQKPDWEKILKNKDDSLYYFTMADVGNDVKKDSIIKVDYEKYLENISNPLCIRKIDYKKHPFFAIVFAKTNSVDEIKNLLKLDMKEFIVLGKH